MIAFNRSTEATFKHNERVVLYFLFIFYSLFFVCTLSITIYARDTTNLHGIHTYTEQHKQGSNRHTNTNRLFLFVNIYNFNSLTNTQIRLMNWTCHFSFRHILSIEYTEFTWCWKFQPKLYHTYDKTRLYYIQSTSRKFVNKITIEMAYHIGNMRAN